MQTIHKPTGDDRPDKPSCSCGWISHDKPCTVKMWHDNHYIPDYAANEGVKNILVERIIAELINAALMERVYRWKVQNSNVMALAWGWWSSVNLSARALAILFGADHSEEAIPIFRSIIEHSLYLVALAQLGDDAVHAAVDRDIRQIRTTFKNAAGGPLDLDLIPGIDWKDLEVPPSQSGSRANASWTSNVYAICEQLGLLNTLYVWYRLACNVAHPTVSGANRYIDDKEGLLRKTKNTMESHMTMWTAACLIWAGKAFCSVLFEPDLLPVYEKAANELTIPPIEELSKSLGKFGALNMDQKRIEQLLNDAFPEISATKEEINPTAASE
jgi:hypothetical protein